MEGLPRFLPLHARVAANKQSGTTLLKSFSADRVLPLPKVKRSAVLPAALPSGTWFYLSDHSSECWPD